MESILMVKILSLDYIRIMFNMIKVWYLFYSSLESIVLVNQILPHVKQIENDDNPLVIENENDYAKLNDKNWSSIIVNEDLYKGKATELNISDYLYVQFIHIQQQSFLNISGLTVSNCPLLQILIIEDNACKKAMSLTLSSIF